MNRSSVFLLRAMVAFAVIALVSLMTHSSALAQLGSQYDVKVMTPAEGAAGELTMPYSIDFNGVAGPVPSQNLTMTNEGRTTYILPPGATSIASVTVAGIRYPWGNGGRICLPWANGCWCLCFRWAWGQFWPWWPRPYLFWYWDPCCP
ncbi:MAG: hypothetical protein ABIR47_12805 [Candidatus Kapaibacterium sp.]